MHTEALLLSVFKVALRIPRSLLLVGAGLMAINLFWLVDLLRHAFRPLSNRSSHRKKEH